MPQVNPMRKRERASEAGEVRLLNQAFGLFNETARKMEGTYRRLERTVQRLNAELKQKNEALEENLREKERSQKYLRTILESIDTGVVVVAHPVSVETDSRLAGTLVEKIRGACAICRYQ